MRDFASLHKGTSYDKAYQVGLWAITGHVPYRGKISSSSSDLARNEFFAVDVPGCLDELDQRTRQRED